MRAEPSPSRILAVKLADVGDVLLITPALRALRQSCPSATLDVLVTPRGAAALEGLPLVDRRLCFDKYRYDRPLAGGWGGLIRLARQLRSRYYDTVILFHHLTLRYGSLKHAALVLATGAPRRIGLDNGRGWFLTHRVRDAGFGASHELDYWLALAAAACRPCEAGRAGGGPDKNGRNDCGRVRPPAAPAGGPGSGAGRSDWSRQVEIAVTETEREMAGRWLPASQRPTVALQPGSGGYSLARRWGLDRFAELGQRLAQRARVVVVGTAADGTQELAARLGDDAVNLGGQTTVQQLAAVLERCDLLVGADSGVLHVASAAGTPVVALFGPTNHRAWAPALPPEKLTIVRSGSACSPCAYVGHHLGTPDGCPERSCMAMIGVDQVLDAVSAALEKNTPAPPPIQATIDPVPAPAADILGVPVHDLTYNDLLERIGRMVAGRRPHQIATVNPEFVMRARSDPIFRVILQRAALCLADGAGLIWASHWLQRGGRGGAPLRTRVTGSDGVPRIAERAAREGWRLFLLGAEPGVAEQTAAILTSRYPGLQIAGTYAGSPAAEEEEAIVQRVNGAQTDVLLVAYGAPRQDKWIARNLPRLQVGVALGVGGTFDYISGRAARAPGWMRRLGLEWLHRLAHQPWRWRRMMALPRFALAVLWTGLRPRRRERRAA